eukprot:gnl/MRDRNA2_/MRDRNA2_28520_c0_seq1.p1 gnl/MRDRNA2_/MRDRNA2_28520_c0~~gnl/MRDRNA2_/MRDRNA2_28520_c0_seq1.p1  ORF type:complete len:571 (+),score=75.65 gnl/MRDRNA2_/MRDRNA2_28520_c0_seq1:72-1784(+)
MGIDEAYEETEENERPRHPPRPDVRDFAFVPPSARLGSRMRGPWDSLDCHTRRVLDEPPEVLCQKEAVNWSSSRFPMRSRNASSYSQTLPTKVAYSAGSMGNERNARPSSARSDASVWSTGPRPQSASRGSRAGSCTATRSRPQTPSKSQILQCGVLPVSGKLLVEVVSIFSESDARLDLEISIPGGSSPPQCVSVDESSVRGFSLEVPDVRQNSLLLRLHDAEPENSMPGGVLQSKLSVTTKYATQEYLPAESYKTMWSYRPKALGSLRVPLCGLAADVPGESLEWSVAGTSVRLRVMFFLDEKPEMGDPRMEKESCVRPSSAPCMRKGRRGSGDSIAAGTAQSAARVRGFRGNDAPPASNSGRPATAPLVRSPPMARSVDRSEALVEGALADAKDRVSQQRSGSTSQESKVFGGSIGEPSCALISDNVEASKDSLAQSSFKDAPKPARPRPAVARSVKVPQSVRPGRYGADTHSKTFSARSHRNRPRSAHGWPGRTLHNMTLTEAQSPAAITNGQQQMPHQQQQPEAEPEGESEYLDEARQGGVMANGAQSCTVAGGEANSNNDEGTP